MTDYEKIFMTALINRSGGEDAITDDTIGGPARGMVSGVAAVASRMDSNSAAEFAKSAKDNFFSFFNHQLKLPTKASGVLELTSNADITIYTGTEVKNVNGAVVAIVAKDTSFTGVETKNIEIVASKTGASVIFEPGTLSLLTIPDEIDPGGTNPSTINNGTNLETETERTLRFRKYLEKMHKGTDLAILLMADEVTILGDSGEVIEAVADSELIYPWIADDQKPKGVNELYIKSTLTSPSTVPMLDPPCFQEEVEIGGLIGHVKRTIDGLKQIDEYGNKTYIPGATASGIETLIKPAVANDIFFNLGIAVKDGYTFEDVGEVKGVAFYVKAAITDYVNSLKMGSRITSTEWQAVVTAVEGVDYIDESTIEHHVGINPPENISTQASYKYWFIPVGGINIWDLAAA